jgi:hypothetical protein
MKFALWIDLHAIFRGAYDPDQRALCLYSSAADAGSLGHMLSFFYFLYHG